MMRYLHAYCLTSLIVACLAVTPVAKAANCGTPSPNLQFSKNVWSPIPARPLSQRARSEVLGFLAGLQGNWKGTGRSTACVMQDATTIPVLSHEQLRLSVRQRSAAEYRFEFSIFDTENKVRTARGFEVLPHGQALEVVGEGVLAITALSANELSFRTQTAMRTDFRRAFGHRFHHGFGRGTTHTVLSLETLRQLWLQGDRLNYSKSVFHNGAMIEFSHWVLQRN